MIEKDKIILPSPDFQRLCLEQLDLFRRIVDPNAVLSVTLVLFVWLTQLPAAAASASIFSINFCLFD